MIKYCTPLSVIIFYLLNFDCRSLQHSTTKNIQLYKVVQLTACSIQQIGRVDVNKYNPMSGYKADSRYRKSISQKIESFFKLAQASNSTYRDLQANELKIFLEKNYDKIDHIHILTILHRSSKINFDMSTIISLNSIFDLLEKSDAKFDEQSLAMGLFSLNRRSCDNDVWAQKFLKLMYSKALHGKFGVLNGHAIGMALYGFRSSSSDSSVVRNVLKLLTRHIYSAASAFDSNSESMRLRGQDISNAIYGLQGMNGQQPEVRELMAALVYRLTVVHHPKLALTAQDVGMSLYGLNKMSCQVPEALQLLERLQPHLYGVQLDHQAVGNALYGLRGMSSGTSVVSATIGLIAEAVCNCKDNLDVRELSSGLYGLQNMNCASPAVLRLLPALTRKVEGVRGSWTGQSLGMALFGLRDMSSEYCEVRDLIAALTRSLGRFQGPFPVTSAALALHGLREMSSDCAEVKALLGTLAGKLRNDLCESRRSWTGHEVAVAFQGFRSLSDCPEGIDLLGAFVDRLKSHSSVSEFSLTDEQFCSSLNGLKRMGSEWLEVREALIMLLDHHKADSEPLVSSSAVSRAFLGLGRMSSGSSEVSRVLARLTELVDSCPVSAVSGFSGKDVGVTLFGLRGSTGEVVLAVIRAMLPHMRVFQSASMDPVAISMALHGLRRLDSGSSEIREALKIIATQLVELIRRGDRLSGRDLSSSLVGLQLMDSSVAEVRLVLRVLLAAVSKSVELDSHSSVMGLYGLRNMDGQVAEVRAMREFLCSSGSFKNLAADGRSVRMAKLAGYDLRGFGDRMRDSLSAVGAQTLMPLLLGFFLLQEQVTHIIPSENFSCL